MQRRTFFRRLVGGFAAAVVGLPAAAAGRVALVQESPVAGFQFHRGEAIWPLLRVNDELINLVRESANSHDENAVAVYFRDQKLGYVPRRENAAVAQMLDRGERLAAKICKLSVSEDPWQRIRFTVSLA